jgi:hypothetical protein
LQLSDVVAFGAGQYHRERLRKVARARLRRRDRRVLNSYRD